MMHFLYSPSFRRPLVPGNVPRVDGADLNAHGQQPVDGALGARHSLRPVRQRAAQPRGHTANSGRTAPFRGPRVLRVQPHPLV